MTINAFVSFAGAFLAAGLAVLVYLKEARSLVHRAFLVGMVALAIDVGLTALSHQAVLPAEALRWQRLRFTAAAFVPGSWLLFSLSFARGNYKEFVARWRWVAIVAFVVPLSLVTLLSDSLVLDALPLGPPSGWLLRLGWSGYAFHVFSLLAATFILMNLEWTLRASTGTMRWQIKFMILGLAGLFAVRIYTSSQSLLFSSVNTWLEVINAGALIVGVALIALSLVRARLLTLDVYLSQAFVSNSLTVFVVGVYLLTVGIWAKAVTYFGGSQILPLGTLFVFLSLLALTVILLSDQLRQEIKRFISRNLRRPQYDYRKEWTAFTRRTSSLVDIKDLCATVAKMVSETLGTPSVTIWLFDENPDGLTLGGSTIFSEHQVRTLKIAVKAGANLIRSFGAHKMPVDFGWSESDWARALPPLHTDSLHEAQIRYGVPLIAGQELLGFITLNERVPKQPLSAEDLDLLKTLADQAAANLLNLKLSQRLARAKEMEAFQSFSTFFLHDLKNLASTLSLTMRNLPDHFDSPEFRKDALRVISHSVDRINAISTRLSLVNQTLELQRVEADLNEVVRTTLADLDGSLKVSPVQDLTPLAKVLMDPEQVQKVLVNLLLNANEAIGGPGQITVATFQRDGWVVLSVTDTGCGMSAEFIARSLFQPFRTTKNTGLGIGLFHSKKIVEAHRGRIEVESVPHKGSAFRVMLPLH